MLVVWLIIATCVGSCSLSPRRAAPRKPIVFHEGTIRLELELVHMGESAVLPAVEVRAGGRDFRFVLDTGTTSLGVSRELSRELDLRILGRARVGQPFGERVLVDLVVAPDLCLGGAVVPAQRAVVLDKIDELNRRFGSRIDGVIGVSQLAHCILRINYPEGWAEIRPSTHGDGPADMPYVALRISDGVLWVPARIEGAGEFVFGLDTGLAMPMVLMSNHMLSRRIRNTDKLLSVPGYTTPLSVAQVRLVEFGGRTIHGVPVVVHEREAIGSAPRGILGSGLFANGELAIDIPNRRVTFRDGGSKQRMSASIGVQVECEDGVTTVVRVDPKSPAAFAGLRVGDVVDAIDESGAPIGVNEFYQALRRRSGVELHVSRGGEGHSIVVVRADYLPILEFS